MVRFCKEELDIESVTVVTNGSKVEKDKTIVSNFLPNRILSSFSKVTKQWMQDFGYYLDILAVSCDSFIAEVFLEE